MKFKIMHDKIMVGLKVLKSQVKLEEVIDNTLGWISHYAQKM